MQKVSVITAITVLFTLAAVKEGNALNACAHRPCGNGGKCHNYIIFHRCQCYSGYSGHNCQTRDFCIRNPCKNRGICTSYAHGYRCRCLGGFTGTTCATRNPCMPNPCAHGGICNSNGNTYTCRCQNGYVGSRCTELSGDCFCQASGDPHYFTFDGQMIHFMGTCKYTLAEAIQGSNLTRFSIEVKNEHRSRNKKVSYTRLVDIKMGAKKLRLLPKGKITINDEYYDMPLYNYLGFTVVYSVGWVIVRTGFGLDVKFDGYHRVIVKVPRTYRNQLTGICGNCNGKKDDLRTKNGEDVSTKANKFSLIGGSYEVPDDSDKPEKNCKSTDVNTSCSASVIKPCYEMVKPNGVFASCNKKMSTSVTSYLVSCTIDVCAYSSETILKAAVICRSFEAYARRCEEIGVPVNWRKSMNCKLTCPQNMEYKFSASIYQTSCTLSIEQKGTVFTEGCVCKAGFVLSGNECVPKSSCGCAYKGLYIKQNTNFMLDDCSKTITCSASRQISETSSCPKKSVCEVINGRRQCKCKTGDIIQNGICQAIASVPDCMCEASGDPHYKTFDGQMIHFMGICKYTLVSTVNHNELRSFHVEVKNEHRGNNRVAYTRLVDLKLYGITLRFLPGGKISVNNELLSTPLNNYMGLSVSYSLGWVTAKTAFGLQVKFDGKHRVAIKVPGRYRGKLRGICGDCNGKKDDWRTKNGTDVSMNRNKFSDIGKSYEVFDDSDKPEKKCSVSDVTTTCSNTVTSKCDVMKDLNGIFGTCLKKLGNDVIKQYFESCKIDVCAYNNVPKLKKDVICRSFEALVRNCEEIGVLVNWRGVLGCTMDCSKRKNTVYKFSVSVSQPTCTNRNPAPTNVLTEGCVCKPGYILSGMECVYVSACGCSYEGFYIKLNTSLLINDCSRYITCSLDGKVQMMSTCPRGSECVVHGGERVCKCPPNYLPHRSECTLAGIINREFLKPVMHMFTRVTVAYIEGTFLEETKQIHVELCARKCMKNNKCKSFNYDELRQNCQIYGINAATSVTLTPSECPYKDYYQRIDTKTIVINGASLLSCVHLSEFGNISSESECKKKCTEHKCKAMEFSQFNSQCSFTHNNRSTFGLLGDDFFKFTEILETLPTFDLH